MIDSLKLQNQNRATQPSSESAGTNQAWMGWHFTIGNTIQSQQLQQLEQLRPNVPMSRYMFWQQSEMATCAETQASGNT